MMESRTCTPRRPRIIAGATILLECSDGEEVAMRVLMSRDCRTERGSVASQVVCRMQAAPPSTMAFIIPRPPLTCCGQVRSGAMTAYVTAAPKTSWRGAWSPLIGSSVWARP